MFAQCTYRAFDLGYRYAEGMLPILLLVAVGIAIATALFALGLGIVPSIWLLWSKERLWKSCQAIALRSHGMKMSTKLERAVLG